MTLLGASAFTLGILGSGAEAKTVYYEINGKRYSYSTSNHTQAAEARKRIQAAKVAEAAKAKAEAEKANYPIYRVFASKTQKEAEEAQEKLKQMLANGRGDSSRGFSLRRAERDDEPSPRTSAPIREASADKDVIQRSAVPQEKPSVPKPSVEAPPAPAIMPAVAEPLTVQHLGKKVRSVSFDVESGIKTTIMIDGSIEEEPIDSGVLSQLTADQGTSSSLMAFVKQLRKASPGSAEATGSITPKADRPELVEVGLSH